MADHRHHSGAFVQPERGTVAQPDSVAGEQARSVRGRAFPAFSDLEAFRAALRPSDPELRAALELVS
jgi:hypothetical protein